MKKNKLFTFFTMLCLISILGTSVIAFDTSNGGSWDAVSAKSGKWAYFPYTGTRYVFRIKCSDGVYRDVGYNNDIVSSDIKNKAALYYINHFQDKSRNITQYEENKGKNINEVVNMGSSLLGYNQVFYGSNYFDTKVSSTNSYDSSNGNYRHITLWIRDGDSNSKHENNVITNNFDVNASDIKKLANTVKSYATAKGDSKTLQQINDIIDGKVSYQIRVESLFKVHIKDGKSNLRGSYDDKDISAYVKGDNYTILTFRECRALHDGAGMGASSTTLFNGSGYVTKGAMLLWEEDSPWYDEYANLYTDFLNDVYKNKDFRYIGWDYLQVDAENNPFNKIVVRYKNEVTGQDIIPSEESPFNTPIKKKDLENYEYTGLEEVTPTPKPKDPKKTEIKISNDGESHEIIFWYKPKDEKTTVTINYKNEKTGELITGFTNPEYHTEPGTYTKKDLESQGYTYTGVEVNKPDHVAKDSSKTSITIPDDKKSHEITFWYKPEEITRIKITHKSESNKILSGPIEFTIKNGESAKTFSQQATAFGSNYEYTGLEKISPEKETKDPSKTSITIGFDGDKTYEIIFWYKMQTHIKIIGKCEGRAGFIYTKDLGKSNLPLKGTYKESSYTPNNYTYLNEYEVKYGTHTYMGKGTTTSGSSVSLDIAESNDAPNQILIVFYYKSNYSATVEHYYVDPTGANSDELKEKYDINIIPGVSKELPSIRMVNKEGTPCINLKYDGLNVTPNNFKQYTRDAYTLTFTPDESNYIIRFYYTSQIIKIRHEKENGKLIEEEEKILNPNEEENPLKDYTFKESKLNDDDPTKDTPVKVPVKEGVPSQELVFIYKDPELIFGPDDPNPEPNPEDYNKKRNEYNTGIIPNDLNNQSIGQDAEKYYWVLNENGEITVRLAVGHMDTGTHSLTCTLKIPFDVYINKIYNKANTECTVKCDYKETKDGYDIYEGNIKDIYVPVWVEEKEYEITGKVNYVYTSADGKAANPINSTATAEVTVVGAVYDFTITNLDGSDTTGDSMWKKSLFPTVKQVEEGYKATATAIGQGTQQPSKYYQAIKRGTRFYFSVNTLGAANNQIEIVPNFYYVSANGQSLEKVTMKSNYMNSTRSINLNDTNRVTTEFSKERAMKNTLDNGATSKAGTVFEVGNYRKLTLNRNVNTPYLGIVNDVKARFAGKELTAILQGTAKTDKDLYKVANHWYADYSVPNDATFYKADGTQVDENGCLVVYFSIITKNNANNEYLAYNLESPFVQSEKISEWNYERKDNTLTKVADYRLVLPKTSVNNASKNITTNDIWIKGTNKAGHTAVIIYSLKQNVSTRQNVTSAGTH